MTLDEYTIVLHFWSMVHGGEWHRNATANTDAIAQTVEVPKIVQQNLTCCLFGVRRKYKNTAETFEQ